MGPPRRVVRRASASATSRTSSRRPRASPRRTRRWAPSSPRTGSSSRSLAGTTSFMHGLTFGGHPVAAAVALANIDVVRARGHPRQRPRQRAGVPRRCSSRCATSRSSATCAAPGYFQAIELVKDQETRRALHPRRVRAAAARVPAPASCSSAGSSAAPTTAATRSSSSPRRSSPGRSSSTRSSRVAAAGAPGGARRLHVGGAGADGPGALGATSASRCSPGEEDLDAPVRWVHISELADPTPWLTGGELLLTTGMGLDEPDAQREYVRRLSDHGLAGLGFGIGFEHDTVPEAMVEVAAERGSRCSRCPSRRPSSRSPRRPSRGWSTSSTRCCSARSPSRSACSASSWRSAGWTRSPRRWRRRSAAPRCSSVGAASRWPATRSAGRSTTRPSQASAPSCDARARRDQPRGFVPAHGDLAARSLALPVAGARQHRRAAGLARGDQGLGRPGGGRPPGPAPGRDRRGARAAARARRHRDRAPAGRRRARRAHQRRGARPRAGRAASSRSASAGA